MTGRLIEFKAHFDKVYGDGVGKETITRSAFPETKFKFRRSKLILKLNLKPRELGFNYPVEIIIDNTPEVWGVGHAINCESSEILHTYNVNNENRRVKLRLYHPSYNELPKSYRITETIIPWTVEWLGGREHPDRLYFQIIVE